MYFNLDTLQIGDAVATCVYRYGNTHVRMVKVVKVSKTTVTVAAEGDALPEIFNKSDGYKRGSRNSWHRKQLISQASYLEIKQRNRLSRLSAEKIAKREELIKALSAATGDDAAFALALEALNQKEYAPNV